VTSKAFNKLGGSGLLAHYDNSLSALLTKVYPNVQWDLLKFHRIPKRKDIADKMPLRYWNNLDNQRNFMNEVAKKLSISSNQRGDCIGYSIATL
jgi:hypothetical protein